MNDSRKQLCKLHSLASLLRGIRSFIDYGIELHTHRHTYTKSNNYQSSWRDLGKNRDMTNIINHAVCCI